MLGEAGRAGRGTGITLGRLSVSNVGELVRASGADALATTLWEESAGVPFFLTEYLTAVLHDPSAAQLPAGVRDLLASRVGDVSRTAAQVMTAAAVIGRPFDPEIVRETSGRSREEVASALDELSEHGLVVFADDAYDFTHPKLREYVYGAATLARRRLLHGRAAVTFLRDTRRHPDSAALAAHHLERAGRDAEAGPLYRVAGDHARSVFANAEALAHYRSALAMSDEGAAAIHEVIGDLLTLQGSYREALASYETAAALGSSSDVERRIGGVHHRLGDWDAADAHYAEALEEAQAAGQRARVLADRSLNAHRAGRRSDARALAREAYRAAKENGDARALAKAHNIAGIVASSVGDAAEARDHLEASLGFAEQLGDEPAIAAALNNLALSLRQDEVDRALELEQRALELTARIGDRHREAALHSNLADLLHAAGRSDEAAEHIRSSAAIFADVGSPDELHPEIWKLVEW
jgi:tetratricopeptide (TPR) repeat protein